MQSLPKKTYQRIDKVSRRWIETVEVAPTPIEDSDGSYSLGYVIADDLVEADAPLDLGMVWTIEGWALEQLQPPPAPPSIQRFLIDENGFLVEPVLISPVLHEDKWVYLGIENPLLIEAAPDPTIAIYKHRWDGMKWIEGATSEEVKKMHVIIPNWAGFLTAYILSDIDDLIMQTSDVKALQKFNRVITMMPNDELLPTIVDAWNACVEGLATPLPTDVVKGIVQLVDKYDIPLEAQEDGKFAIANISGN